MHNSNFRRLEGVSFTSTSDGNKLYCNFSINIESTTEPLPFLRFLQAS